MRCLILLTAFSVTLGSFATAADDLKLKLRYQTETSSGSGRYHRLTRAEQWSPKETAIVVCDVWDLHHCLNAVRREEEMAPRLNKVLTKARAQGITIIHAPSSCMEAYADSPARKRAMQAPLSANLPADIKSWCTQIPSEEKGIYPIDQTDGGEDDDLDEHAAWAKKLASMGRKPRAPWKKQSDLITIDEQRDFISDRGDEVWNVLESRGIKNVILTGVHTNMCVLGRPFGLRQMAKNGKNVVLMRDMTDTMYNPQRWPYVSHFTGTDLIVSHIEKFVCPTISSDQFLGGKPFRYQNDTRPHVVIVMAEREYETHKSLPAFAANNLGRDFRVSYVFADSDERNDLPGVEAVGDADVLLVSVRRRVLSPEKLAYFHRHVESGKPVVGIRTASHAFSLRKQTPPDGFAAWPEFDSQVFGGNYVNHYGNQLPSTIRVAKKQAAHPILTGVAESFAQGGSLYRTAPLAKGTTLLLSGKVADKPAEPAAWTFTREDGGRSFYTSLGHVKDFENESFARLLLNGILWAAEKPVPAKVKVVTGIEPVARPS